jgi:prevent-host-death family protein
MATRAVGIRELKQHAPALVGCAARGERIVITRHGRPQAQLGPIERSDAGAGPADVGRMKAFALERAAFERLLPRLVPRYRGRYVAVQGGRVVGADRDPDRLFERVWRKAGGRTFFIGRVGAPPPIVEMPGFEVGE